MVSRGRFMVDMCRENDRAENKDTELSTHETNSISTFVSHDSTSALENEPIVTFFAAELTGDSVNTSRIEHAELCSSDNNAISTASTCLTSNSENILQYLPNNGTSSATEGTRESSEKCTQIEILNAEYHVNVSSLSTSINAASSKSGDAGVTSLDQNEYRHHNPIGYSDIETSDDYVPDTTDTSSEAEQETPSKNNRWRRQVTSKWKSNIVVHKRKSGLSYKNKAGKLQLAKKPKTIYCSDCKFKCTALFNVQDRDRICTDFWNVDYNRQKDFIIRFVLSVGHQKLDELSLEPLRKKRVVGSIIFTRKVKKFVSVRIIF